MNKTYLIIGGVLLVTILVFVWIYLLIYGTPKPVENFFTDFSFAENSDNELLPPLLPEVTDEQIDVTDTAKLRQLTTRAVIGFGEKISNNQDERFVLYAEAGTGHIFSINLITGTETRLSNITIPNAQKARFSPDGTVAAIRSGYGSQNSIELVTLSGENNSTKETLTPQMVDFTFSTENKLFYTEYNSSGLLGRELNPTTKLSRTLFSIPFQNAIVVWSMSSSTPHFVYPKPSAKLSGFLYKISNGTLLREQAAGNGLVALAHNNYFIHTVTTSRGPVSFVTNRTTGMSNSLPIIVEPSKCTFSTLNSETVYCGYEETTLNYEFPDNWYKGQISFADSLWEINVRKGLAVKLIDTKSETGRELDSIGMDISTQNKVLYFINKNDNTLWMYEI